MEYSEKARQIIEKFKKENKAKTAIDEILIDRIEGAINAIESSEEQMSIDAEKKSGTMKSEEAGYGFIWSRLGDKKMHPGITIIEKQKQIISKSILELGVSSKPEEKKGKLGDLMQVTGGKKKNTA